MKIVATKSKKKVAATKADRIIHWRKKGWGYVEIAKKVKVSMAYVWMTLKEAGMTTPRKKKRKVTTKKKKGAKRGYRRR